MLDSQLLRDHAHDVASQLAKRGFHFDAKAFLNLEEQRKELQIATQALQNERNQRSKAIGMAKAQGQDIEAMRAEVNQMAEELERKKEALDQVLAQMDGMTLLLPNIPHSSVPEGRDEQDNQEVRRWGQPQKFAF